MKFYFEAPGVLIRLGFLYTAFDMDARVLHHLTIRLFGKTIVETDFNIPSQVIYIISASRRTNA